MTIYVMRNATCSAAFVPLLPGNTGDVISRHAELIVNVVRDGMAKLSLFSAMQEASLRRSMSKRIVCYSLTFTPRQKAT
jgi:hypothetical protein